VSSEKHQPFDPNTNHQFHYRKAKDRVAKEKKKKEDPQELKVHQV